MSARPSARIASFMAALPLAPGMRVLEIGCGPGAAARLAAQRVAPGQVLGIDRSAKAIALAQSASAAEIASGALSFHQVAVEDFALGPEEPPFDLAFAMRVGALDGRHPELEHRALAALARALTPEGRLFIGDGANPTEIALPR